MGKVSAVCRKEFMIVFLSCSKTKSSCTCKATEMYQGDLFKKSLEYAKKLKPRKIYILSAKYKVLELEDIISPYNLTLNTMSKHQQKKWAYDCFLQLKAKGQDFNEEAIFLCGENYRKYLLQLFKNSKAPLQGVSFGNQLKFYKKSITK